MEKQITYIRRWKEYAFLGALTFMCFSFSMTRYHFTDSRIFLFLNWNLFLAFIPWVLTQLTILTPRIERSKIAIFLLMLVWLLFFPNAPYILTDLIHLKHRSNVPMWFDLILILSFAWTGLMYGLMSLWEIERILGNFFKRKYVIFLSMGLLFLCSFGVYLGRFLRWNSWDVINEPDLIIQDTLDRLINPLQHPSTWGLTILLGIFLNIVYFSFELLKNRTSLKESTS